MKNELRIKMIRPKFPEGYDKSVDDDTLRKLLIAMGEGKDRKAMAKMLKVPISRVRDIMSKNKRGLFARMAELSDETPRTQLEALITALKIGYIQLSDIRDATHLDKEKKKKKK